MAANQNSELTKCNGDKMTTARTKEAIATAFTE